MTDLSTFVGIDVSKKSLDVAKLPSDLRVLAERLKHDSVAKIARDTGIPRRTLRDRIERLRAFFEADGLQEYLANGPPLRLGNR